MLRDLVGKDRLVMDLSCRKRPEDAAAPDAPYYVVTNKWTQVRLSFMPLQCVTAASL